MLRRVHVESGWLEGAAGYDPRITVFKGVPYAKPPVGERRWKAPEPLEAWEGVRKADVFPHIAYQKVPESDPDDFYTKEFHYNTDGCIADEDCLYLNIWTPAASDRDNLPVYVWVHGGGLKTGYSWEPEIDGEQLAREGIILVTVGYRLNAFGFLYHEDFPCANFGLLDLEEALKWIKRNILFFGGTPDRVTIGGQSAGAWCVTMLAAAERTRGLFHGVIAHSGGGLRNFGYGPSLDGADTAAERSRDFFRLLGVSTVDEARKKSSQEVYEAALAYMQSHGRMNPIVDGRLLKEEPTDAMLRNHHHRVPMLIGSTTGEGPGNPAAPKMPENAEELQGMAQKLFHERAEEFLKLCPMDCVEDIRDLVKSEAFNMRAVSARAYAEVQAQYGRGDYFYIFDADIPGADHAKAYHGSDLWFVFHTLGRCWRPFEGKHYDLARTISGYWVNFIKTGNPNGTDCNGNSLPQWNGYCMEDPFIMKFKNGAEKSEQEVDAMTRFRIDYHRSQYQLSKTTGVQ